MNIKNSTGLDFNPMEIGLFMPTCENVEFVSLKKIDTGVDRYDACLHIIIDGKVYKLRKKLNKEQIDEWQNDWYHYNYRIIRPIVYEVLTRNFSKLWHEHRKRKP